jgi:hypothetical protein
MSTQTTPALQWYPEIARLAPSKHNTQPWRFVVRDDCLEVWSDPRRSLSASDPLMRELIISCGAAVHHIEVAARASGRSLSVELLPEGGVNLIARVRDVGSQPAMAYDEAMLEAIGRRRTDRGPLDASVLPPSLPFQLQSAATLTRTSLRLVGSAGDRATLGRLIERADRILVRDPRQTEELQHWVREPQDARTDGVPSDRTRGAAASYRAEFVQRDFSRGPGPAAHDRVGKDQPLVGVLVTSGDTPLDWVRAGRGLSAVLLEATVVGANASYLNQPLEVPGLRAELHSALMLPGYPQAILRIGAGGPVAATPRRPIAELLTEAWDQGPGSS